MRPILLSLGFLLGLLAPLFAQWRPPSPFVPVGVAYEAGASAEEDFATIKSLGFNSVRLRGTDATDKALAELAAKAGLHLFTPRDDVMMVEVQAGPPPGSARRVSSADLRLSAWDAIARGARAVFFSNWSGPMGLVDDDGVVTPRARTAGEFAGIVSRNASLFAALRPRTGESSRVRVQGDTATVDARFLDSPAATLIIAMNRAEYAQKVTFHFSPDTPEAIWQNLENGAAVSFVMGKDGPYLAYAFLARDALVLVRSNRLR